MTTHSLNLILLAFSYCSISPMLAFPIQVGSFHLSIGEHREMRRKNREGLNAASIMVAVRSTTTSTTQDTKKVEGGTI